MVENTNQYLEKIEIEGFGVISFSTSALKMRIMTQETYSITKQNYAKTTRKTNNYFGNPRLLFIKSSSPIPLIELKPFQLSFFLL